MALAETIRRQLNLREPHPFRRPKRLLMGQSETNWWANQWRAIPWIVMHSTS